MKHYSQMSDEELGRALDAANEHTDTPAAYGRAVRAWLDSMEPDELAEVRAEVDRTARVVMALATGRTFWHTQQITGGEEPYIQALSTEESHLCTLRSRQRDLESQRAAAKGGKR